MDYKKRDNIRNEIDVLINRIVLLQEQEKKYKNYTEDLILLESELDSQKRIYEDLKEKINDSKNTLNSINKSIIDREGKLKLHDFDIKKLESIKTDRQNEINTCIDEYNQKTATYQASMQLQEKDYAEKIKVLEKDYNNIIGNHKKQLQSIEAEKNSTQKIIEENKIYIENQNSNIAKYKKSLGEIEKEYSTHRKMKDEKEKIIQEMNIKIDGLERRKKAIIKKSDVLNLENEKIVNKKIIIENEIEKGKKNIEDAKNEKKALQKEQNAIIDQINTLNETKQQEKRELELLKKKWRIPRKILNLLLLRN